MLINTPIPLNKDEIIDWLFDTPQTPIKELVGFTEHTSPQVLQKRIKYKLQKYGWAYLRSSSHAKIDLARSSIKRIKQQHDIQVTESLTLIEGKKGIAFYIKAAS